MSSGGKLIRGRGLIASSILIAYLLTILPMPAWAENPRPAWVLMVLVYWCLATPHILGVSVAWVVGLILDVLTGSLLGLHALTCALSAYLALLNYQRVRMAPLVQQALFVGSLVLIEKVVVFAIMAAASRPNLDWRFLLAVPVSMAIWPWVFLILRDLRRTRAGGV